ncbi:alpha/beta hydrolase family protein [Marinicella sp. W31]|uniref:alpha/beta hydrolase family protein n=1 Tax=Marinicella sp. W31 TaxID=3023713 RepID=UPI0037575C3A
MNKKSTYISYLLMLCVSASISAQDLQGDWEGVLGEGGADLPLIIHITKSPDGKHTGTLDSPKQGGYGVPMSTLEIEGNRLIFEIKDIGVYYEGLLNQEGLIEGKFVQGTAMDLTFSRQQKIAVDYSESSDQNDIIGSWSGPIELPGAPLQFVIHIKQGDGGLEAEADSPDQGSFGMKIDEITFKTGELKIKINVAGVVYNGRLLADQQSIQGFFEQGGGKFILNMKKTNGEKIQSKRPQMPQPPFEYDNEEVVVNNAHAGIELAGTLTFPKGKIAKAVAIMITGSGPQDRDETIFNHKPFWVIADHLSNNGYAVLRMDDRGVGKSKGDFSAATSADFATDISAAIDYLQTRKDIPHDKIGLIGHSEGGMIAPMVATDRDDVAFAILLAGPGIPIVDLLAEQSYLIESSQGGDKAALEKKRMRNLELNQQIAGVLGAKDFKEKASEYLTSYFIEAGLDEEQIHVQKDNLLKQYDSPWFAYFLKFEPAKYLSRLTVPVLALNGALDLQVAADSNLKGIQEALQLAQNSDYTIKKLDKMNHLFQTTETGKVSEYGVLEETFSIQALNIMTEWLDQRF